MIERKRYLVSLSFESAASIAFVTEAIHKLSFGLFPENFMITSDQVKLLREDNSVSPLADAEGRTLHGFGISPEPYETLVPLISTAIENPGSSLAPVALESSL